MIKYDVLLYDATHDYDQLYTYHHGTPLNIGERVLVPFGPKNVAREAVVVRPSAADRQSKAVIERLALPGIPQPLIALFFDLERYYLCPMGQLLRLALPMALRVRPQVHYEETATNKPFESSGLSAVALDELLAQGRIQRQYHYQPVAHLKSHQVLVQCSDAAQLEAFREQLPKRQRKVRALLSTLIESGEVVLDRTILPEHLAVLENSGLVCLDTRVTPSANAMPSTLLEPLAPLSGYQQTLIALLQSPEAHLLQGPVGSGKRLILMHLVKRVLKQKRRFLWLVSDSMQAMATHRELYRYFGEDIALLHAHQSRSEILYQHQQIVNGRCVGVVGSRNTLFAPLDDIGLIIVEACEDDRFVSEQPDFDFRKAAVFYAAGRHIPLVMTSLVPDLFQLADTGIRKHYLPAPAMDRKRHWHIVDTRTDFSSHDSLLSEAVLEALRHKSMVFMNRLGYAGAVLCEHCLHVERCSQCQSTLFYTPSSRSLVCRQCGAKQPFHALCPRCQQPMQLRGSGTERLQEHLQQHFPLKQIERFDSLSLRRKSDMMQLSERLEKADILVATSMLSPALSVADLKNVVHVAPDATLFLPDYRSAERTFRDLILTGAMTDAQEESAIYIQTEVPDNYVYSYAIREDILSFLKYEYKLRQHHGLPPYMHLIRIVLQHQEADKCLAFATRLHQALCKRFSYTCRGPYRPIYEKKGKYYEQNLLLSDLSEMQDLKNYLRTLVPRGAQRMRIIVDPRHIMY